jgi:hypothetical protein
MHGFFLWIYNEAITKFEKLWHNKQQVCLKMIGQIEFKPIFSLDVYVFYYDI